jgi:beta-glucuronidase
LERGQGRLRVRAELFNLTDTPLDGICQLRVDGQEMRAEPVHLEAGGSQVLLFGLTLPKVTPWSPGDPRLYTVQMSFGGDDLIERTGFRQISVRGTEILLNGAPVRLFGVNRHEDHPDWGFALPEHLILRDLDLVHDLGANAIRGSHYPQDPRMIDLCDERGILLVEEIPLWGFGPEQLSIDMISDRAAAMAWGMVERDINHPCIWAWSVLNECGTEAPEGRAVVERLVETVRELDDTRLVTYASDKALADICFDLVDVVCLNAYFGWYRHDMTWPAFLDRMRAKIGNKPMIVSEFGAGALYGCHTLAEGMVWSEEYQCRILSDCIAHFIERDDLAGFFIWQFCDTRSDRGARALGRPRGYNNKGILDEYRRPKLAYSAVRGLMRRG